MTKEEAEALKPMLVDIMELGQAKAKLEGERDEARLQLEKAKGTQWAAGVMRGERDEARAEVVRLSEVVMKQDHEAAMLERDRDEAIRHLTDMTNKWTTLERKLGATSGLVRQLIVWSDETTASVRCLEELDPLLRRALELQKDGVLL